MSLVATVVSVNGNLTVTGTTTTINTTNSAIQDNVVTLNAGFLGALNTDFVDLKSGIEVNRGQQASGGSSGRPTVGIRWNENLSRWEFSNDGTTYYEIARGPALRHIVEDTIPQLGNDLDTNGFSIFLKPVDPAPANNPGFNVLYSVNSVGSGGTGIKFVTSKSPGVYIRDELVSRKKSIVHSLIFG